MPYVYNNYHEVQAMLKKLPCDFRNNFDIKHLIQEELPAPGFYVPLKGGLQHHDTAKEAFQTINEIAYSSTSDDDLRKIFEILFAIHSDVFKTLIVEGSSFILVDSFTDEFVIENMDQFVYNRPDRRWEYQELQSPKDDYKQRMKISCAESVGEAEERIADICKMLELILLFLAGQIDSKQREAFLAHILDIDTNGLVITQKYPNPVDFLKVFFEREEKVRKLMNRKRPSKEE